MPAVNQIEVHPYLANDEVRAYGQEHGIVTEAWSPLAQGAGAVRPGHHRASPSASARTPSQVVLRWHVQRGDVVFPKTMSTARMRENLDIFGFELGADDVGASPASTRARPDASAPIPTRSTGSPG